MYLKTTEVTCSGGNADSFRPQENKQDKPKNNTDKPFRSVLNEVMNSLLDKAYPTARTYEKEGKG